MTIMLHTEDNIETQITLLPPLLKVFALLKMQLWYDNEKIEENVVDNIGIRYRNCGKTTGLSVKNTNNKDTVTKFVLNKVLHHVGLSCILETNQKLEYDIYEHNKDWLTNGTWYTHIPVQNYMEKCLKNILEMQKLKYIILYVLLIHTRNNSHHMFRIVS